MPADPRVLAPAAAGGAGADVYLAITTRRAGKVKGESTAADHKEEIVVTSWKWGVAASSALGSSQATGRRSYSNLVVFKQIDCASTALLSVLTTNDEVKEAKLAMRKSGQGQRDFFTITLSAARVVGVDLECDATGQTVEKVTFSFNKVQVDYEIQQGTGGRGAGFSFQDEILPA
jgi:type VI secretion system secreted protein Hcp